MLNMRRDLSNLGLGNEGADRSYRRLAGSPGNWEAAGAEHHAALRGCGKPHGAYPGRRRRQVHRNPVGPAVRHAPCSVGVRRPAHTIRHWYHITITIVAVVVVLVVMTTAVFSSMATTPLPPRPQSVVCNGPPARHVRRPQCRLPSPQAKVRPWKRHGITLCHRSNVVDEQKKATACSSSAFGARAIPVFSRVRH